MPLSSGIKAIETTKCNTLIALVLNNNNIVVFDLNTGKQFNKFTNYWKICFTKKCVWFFNKGTERKCVHLENVNNIERVKFLPFSITNKSLYLANSPQVKIETRLVCLTNDGKLSMIDCTLGNMQSPFNVYTPKYNCSDFLEILYYIK